MKKIKKFSFQGVNGAYSEQAGNKFYPDAKVFHVQLLKKCLNK